MTFAQRRPTTFFLLATLLLTYLVGPVAFLSLRELQRFVGTSLPGVNDIVMKFGPTLAGFLTVALAEGQGGVKDLIRRCARWRFPVQLYLFATLVQVVVLVAVLLVQGHGAELGSVSVATALRVFGLQLLLNVFLGGGLSEEVGWRGFMLPQLCKRYRPLAASLLVAIAWFVWHIPAYVFFGKGTSDPILPFAVIVFPFSIVLAWSYFRSGGSLLLPILLHGSINASFYSMVELLPAVTGAPTFQPAFDWAVAGCWSVLAVIVVTTSRFSLARGPVDRPIPSEQPGTVQQ